MALHKLAWKHRYTACLMVLSRRSIVHCALTWDAVTCPRCLACRARRLARGLAETGLPVREGKHDG